MKLSVEDCIRLSVEDDDHKLKLLDELIRLRIEGDFLHKLLEIHSKGCMATSGRNLWHTIRKYKESYDS